MTIIFSNTANYFEEKFSDLKCQADTRAYIIGIFKKYCVTSDFDFHKDNAILLFAQAREKHNFSLYQSLADAIFFQNSLFPGGLKHGNKDYYDTIGQLSYYSCYNLINKQWKLFEELADQFVILEEEIKTLKW